MASEPLPSPPVHPADAPETPAGPRAVPPPPALAPAPVPFGNPVLWTALLALALTATLFLFQFRIDWNPSDEGFLWYGAVRTAHGGVPLRDFRSYDPGR